MKKLNLFFILFTICINSQATLIWSFAAGNNITSVAATTTDSAFFSSATLALMLFNKGL